MGILTVLDVIFGILEKFNLNFKTVGEIIAGGVDGFKKVKEALANQTEPTLEQIAAKAAELRDPVDL